LGEVRDVPTYVEGWGQMKSGAQDNSRMFGLAPWVFAPAAIAVIVFSAFAIILPESTESFFKSLEKTVVNTFNWYYVLITALFVAFVAFVAFSRLGDVKLGKDADEPEFSLGSWFSLLFAAGMG